MMQAIEISTPGGPEVLKITQRPSPSLASGQVLIKVAAAGVNRPDVVQRLGLYPPPAGVTDIPGLEVAGTVTEIGAGVTGVSVGQFVCALVPGGGYAEYCVAPIETVLPVPAGWSTVDAASLPETFFTVWSNLIDRAHLVKGESLLVHGGSSGIGAAAIQLAKALGIEVFTTVGSAEKAAFCKGLGADHVINYRTEDFTSVIAAATSNRGVDVVLDMVGGDYINRNISCLAPDGRHVSIAFLGGPKATLNMMPVMLKRLTLTGSTLRPRDNVFKGAIAAALKQKVWPLMEAGKIKPVVGASFPLAQADKAHALMESSAHMGKIILTVG